MSPALAPGRHLTMVAGVSNATFLTMELPIIRVGLSVETDVQDSDPEDNGYIKVLPETDPTNNLSRASTPSSDNHQYVNVEEVIQKPEPECDTDSGSESNYENVHHPCLKTEMSSQSEEDEDDDDEGNYVNQQPMTH